jgi:hypothetical protein
MTDDVWNNYLNGVKLAYENKIAAEKQAQKEREERERIALLERTRRQSLYELRLKWDGEDFYYEDILFKWDEVLTLTDEEFNSRLKIAAKRMKQIEANEKAEKERIRIENQKLIDENNRKKELHRVRSSQLTGLWVSMPSKYAEVNYIELSETEFDVMLNEAMEANKTFLAEKQKREEEAENQRIEKER